MTGTVGLIGGGQLARMTVQAAIALDIDVVVLCEDDQAPAVRAGATHCWGRPDQLADLVRLAECTEVVTLDHERTPAHLLARLAELGHRVAPGATAARLGQDKARARADLARLGVMSAPWTLTRDAREVEAFGEAHGWPLVIKLRSGGYDGRGLWTVRSAGEASDLLGRLGRSVLIEPQLCFTHELSVVAVRSWNGEIVVYPVVETRQHEGQCHEVLLPATVPPGLAREARRMAATIAEAVDLVGVMAVELFVMEGRLLLNELAVRTHNSAHLTIEACTTSQFENHLRAVLGLPLGATDAVAAAASMVNVIGAADGSDPFDDLHRALRVPGAHVHRYGKDAKPRRKLGHVTATGANLEEARATAARAAGALSGALVP